MPRREIPIAKATAARTALPAGSLAERPNPGDLQAKAQAIQAALNSTAPGRGGGGNAAAPTAPAGCGN